MSGLFSTPKMPAATSQFTAPPSRDASDVQAEVTSDRMRRSAMRGRGATLLTAGTEALGGDRRKTLLGE